MLPNILICGTPGTGKTNTARLLSSELKNKLALTFNHINVGELVEQQGTPFSQKFAEHFHFSGLHDGRDEKFGAFIQDDDKVLRVCGFVLILFFRSWMHWRRP